MVEPDGFSVVLRTDTRTFLDNQEEAVKAVGDEVRAVLGYVMCQSCLRLVVGEVARVTGGHCGECFRGLRASKVEKLEVLIDGARTKIAIDRPKRKRYGSRGSKDTRRKAEAAKRRALRRLRYEMPDVYEALLAQERAKVGLDPFPLGRMVRTETVIDASAYDPGDGPEDLRT